MHELQSQDLKFDRVLTDKTEGLAKYRAAGESMKVELIEDRAGETSSPNTLWARSSSIFAAAPTSPLARSSRSSNSSPLPALTGKATKKNQQLQRIYGTAWFTQKELDEYLAKLEEAKKRDHRKIGKELDLFSIQELAGPGLIFFHPKGGIIRKQIEDWMREQYLKTRLFARLYPPRRAPRPLENLRPRQFLQRQHVRPHGA